MVELIFKKVILIMENKIVQKVTFPHFLHFFLYVELINNISTFNTLRLGYVCYFKIVMSITIHPSIIQIIE